MHWTEKAVLKKDSAHLSLPVIQVLNFSETIKVMKFMESKVKIIVSIATFFIGVALGTYLLINQYVSEKIFLATIGVVFLFSISWPLLSRIRELDIKNLKLGLEKIEEAQKNVYAKESKLSNTIISMHLIIDNIITSIKTNQSITNKIIADMNDTNNNTAMTSQLRENSRLLSKYGYEFGLLSPDIEKRKVSIEQLSNIYGDIESLECMNTLKRPNVEEDKFLIEGIQILKERLMRAKNP